MNANTNNVNAKVTTVKSIEHGRDSKRASGNYQAPKLHDVGKATELVQGGGGGNYLDANRSRYY